MSQVIIDDLEAIKSQYARERRTAIENAEEAVFEEKKIEEQEVIVLMDRFGYTRSMDVPTYERNKEAADLESKHVVSCLNTGKICIFTNTGRMHQVKVLDIPYGKFRDKGTPIDNLSNFDSAQEKIVYICDENQFRIATLLFATKLGMVKKVSGEEFLVGKRTIAATKIGDGDELLSVQIINSKQSVVIQTAGGYFLRFHGSEISEMKKTAAGVRGIKLQKKDVVEQVYLFEEGKETKVIYKEKELSLNRLKQSSRGGVGNKQRG
jgi:DNA gyrase subunit A